MLLELSSKRMKQSTAVPNSTFVHFMLSYECAIFDLNFKEGFLSTHFPRVCCKCLHELSYGSCNDMKIIT